MRMRWQGGDGEFGDMGVLRLKAGDAAQAEARAEPIDQVADLGGLLGWGMSGKARLYGRAALRDGGEAHEVVTETGIAGLAYGCEPVGEEAADAVRLAQRRAGPHRDAADLAVGAEQRDFEEAGALSPHFHRIAEPYAEAGDRSEHVTLARDRFGEMLLGHEGRRGPARRDRLVCAAERLIETAQKGCLEAGGKHRARQIEHVGDAVEPDIGERRDGLRSKAQRRKRQRRERLPHRAGRDDKSHPLPACGERVTPSAPSPTLPRLRGRESRGARRVGASNQRLVARPLTRRARIRSHVDLSPHAGRG